MPIIVPNPPPVTTPPVARDTELAYQRRNTTWFIAWNPSNIDLIPTIKVKTGSGTKRTDGTPRATQVMRLIPQNETTTPFTTDDGSEHVVSYVLLAEWDCSMEIGDHWVDSNGSRYEVLDTTTNGYEVKGLIEQHKVR